MGMRIRCMKLRIHSISMMSASLSSKSLALLVWMCMALFLNWINSTNCRCLAENATKPGLLLSVMASK